MAPPSPQAVNSCLQRAWEAAYGKGAKPKPWQKDAILKTVKDWQRRTFLYDHPRGSGKTREMSSMALIALRFLETRLVLVIVDRKDLEQQIFKEFSAFFNAVSLKALKANPPEVLQCENAAMLGRCFRELEDGSKRFVLCVTLQSFPHVKQQLSAALQEHTIVLADEVHRSHADQALSEELTHWLGSRPRLLMYTGTASDRTLRLFGVKEGDSYQPFHSVTEEDVARLSMIFGLRQFERTFRKVAANVANLQAAAEEHGLDHRLTQSLLRMSQSTPEAIKLKAGLLAKEFDAFRQDLCYKAQAQLLVVAETREMVLCYSEAFKVLAPNFAPLEVYGAFSGKLTLGDRHVDENIYNKDIEGPEPHKKANVLVVCDRFETGYDNSAVSMLGIDRHFTSYPKLVQVYSRANRRRPGKRCPQVVDFANDPLDVERAIIQFANPRRAEAEKSDVVELSKNLQEILLPAGEGLGMKELVSSMAPETLLNVARKVVLYLRIRKQGVSREHQNLLEVSAAERLWEQLKTEQHVDAAALRLLEKELVKNFTSPTGISMAGLVAPNAWTLPAQLETPTKQREVNAACLSSEKQSHTQQSLGKLQAMKETLATGERGMSQQSVEEGQLHQMELDVKKLSRTSVPKLQRPQFNALHRLVTATGNHELVDKWKESKVASQIEGIFLARLRCGEACEHGLAIQGLTNLVVFRGLFPKAEEMMKALKQFRALVEKDGDPLQVVKSLCPFVQSQCDVRQQVRECRKQMEGDLPNQQLVALQEKLKELEQGGAGLQLDFFLRSDLLGHLVQVATARRQSWTARKDFIDLFLTLDHTLETDSAYPGRAQLRSAAMVAKEIQQLTLEACYEGKKAAQRRQKLKGNLTAQQLAEMRQRWMERPEEQRQLFAHLGGSESFMFLVRVASTECQWPLAKEISVAWKTAHELGFTKTAWREPEDESLPSLLRSFQAAMRKRKAKAMAPEADLWEDEMSLI